MITPNFRLFLIGLALLLGVSMCTRANINVAYDTLDTAVVAAMDAADALAPKAEAGGSIYQCGDKYIIYPPVTDGKKNSVDIPVYALVDCVLSATYHTHPAGSRKFSKTDVLSTCHFHTLAYVRPKGGPVMKFDCRTLSDGGIQARLAGM